jgi:hypothetical protein
MTDAERRVIAARCAALAPALIPYVRGERADDDDRIAAALAAMFGSFRSMRQQGENAVATIHCTMHALSRRRVPVWAIEEACLAIQSNGYERRERDRTWMERAWPPSDAEICASVEAVVRPYREAYHNGRALLTAPVEENR